MAGWTQSELANKIQVSDSTINRYENDLRRPDLETLLRLADLLEVSIEYLVDKAEESPLGQTLNKTSPRLAQADIDRFCEAKPRQYETNPRDINQLLNKDVYFQGEQLTDDDLATIKEFVNLVAKTIKKIKEQNKN